jgi:uncharacterized protein YkwD
MVVPVPLPPLGAPAPAGQAATAPIPPAPCPAAPGSAAARADLLAGLNADRAAAGLAPLRASGRLDAIALGHACDLAGGAATGHVGSDGSTLPERLSRGGYRHGYAAENVFRGGEGRAGGVLAFWQGSPGHRRNLLHPAMREAGLGVAAGRDGRLSWVLLLAEPR